MKGKKKQMEKLLSMLMVLGMTVVISGTLTACSAHTNEIVKEAAVQVEIGSEEEVEDLEVQLKDAQEKIDEETKKANIVESTDSEIELEAQLFWQKYNEVLKPFVANGLDYSTFKEIYRVYRVGNEDVISADDAYQMTYKECERRFKVEETENQPSIAYEGNITKNSDGTYEYSEQFMTEIRKRPYFEGATDEEIITFLDDVIGFFDGVEEDLDSETMDSILDAFDDGNLHEENKTITESQTGKTTESQGNSNSGNNNQSSNNNPPVQNTTPAPEQAGSSSDWDVDSSFPGQVGPVGGEGKTDIDLNIH